MKMVLGRAQPSPVLETQSQGDISQREGTEGKGARARNVMETKCGQQEGNPALCSKIGILSALGPLAFLFPRSGSPSVGRAPHSYQEPRGYVHSPMLF